MLLRPFIAATGLAAAANAFLLPPELSKTDIEIIEAIPAVDAVWNAQNQAKAQTVNIECAGCPPVFQNHHGKPKKHHKQHPSHLELDFSIDESRLMVNGFELYPNSDPFTNVLVAPQIAEHKNKKHHNKHHKDDEHNTKALKSHHKFRPHDKKPKAVEQQLGFSLQIQPTQTNDDVLDLIIVDLQIIEVGSIFVDSLPNVRVHLIKSPENELLIAKIEQTASSQSNNGEECTTILCKWRAIIAAQLAKMKMQGCAGMLGHKAGHSGHHGQHHGQNPGQMSHRHRHQHGWALLFRKLTSHIILPVLVGIVAGVTVSILGMLVGTILVGLWRKVVRGQSFFPSHTCRRFGRSTHRHHHKAPQQEAALAEEKSALMAAQEDDELPPPPSYEEEVERV